MTARTDSLRNSAGLAPADENPASEGSGLPSLSDAGSHSRDLTDAAMAILESIYRGFVPRLRLIEVGDEVIALHH